MAEINNIKTQFIGGEQTSSLNSRVDIDQYYKGVKKALNVAIDQSGTIKRRSGTRIVRELKNGISGIVDNNYKLYKITGEDNVNYLIAFYDNMIWRLDLDHVDDIINGNSSSIGIDNSFDDYFTWVNFVDFNDTQVDILGDPNFIRDMDVDVSLNTMVITHPKYAPRILYIDENGFGHVEDISFKSIPQFNFNDKNSPESTPFNAKFTMMRPARTIGDATSFSFSIDGNVSNKITTSKTTANFAAIGREIDLNIPLNEYFDLKLRESSSKYTFERGKAFNIEPSTGYNVKGNILEEKSFYWGNTQGSEEDFCIYLTKKLIQIFFLETCDYPISENILDHVLLNVDTNDRRKRYLPIYVEYISGSFNNLKIKLHASGGMVIDEKYDPEFDTDELPFVFSAAGYYELLGDVVVKNHKLPSQKTNSAYVYPPSEPVDVNTSPWGIFFSVKKQIKEMNIVSNMRNVFVWSGTYGIFAPYGGGQDSLGETGRFKADDALDEKGLHIGGFATPESIPSKNINGSTANPTLSQVDYVILNGVSFNNDLAHYILGDYSSDTSGIDESHPLQYPPFGQRLTYGERIYNLVYSINIDIKNDDAKSYKFDAINDTERAGYRDAQYNEDVAIEAEYATIIINKKGNSREEPAFSELRGYPSKCKFIDRRLCFANTPQLPNRLWFSVVDDFFNFQDDEDGTDISAINNVAPISKAQESIEALTGNKSLQVFTTDSEHYNPSEITANEISLPQQSNYGIKKGTDPVVLDNATFYIDKLNNLRAFIYDDLEQSYKSYNMSVLSKHLMQDVFKIKPVRTNEGTFIYCLNNDGSITVFQTLREQNIRNFVLWKNDNVQFKDIIEYNGKVLAIANRSLVVFDENTVGDLAITRTKGDFYQDINLENLNTKYLLESSELSAVRDIVSTRNYTYTSPHADKVLYVDHALSSDGDFLEFSDLTTYNVENPDFQDPMTDQPFFYFEDLRDAGFRESGFEFSYNFPVEIETKDIAYDLGRGQELVGRKKFTRAWISLNNATQWHLYKDGYKYSPTEYFTGYSGNFERITGDVEIRLTGYHNRVNIKLIQDYPLLGGEVQAITLAIKT